MNSTIYTDESCSDDKARDYVVEWVELNRCGEKNLSPSGHEYGLFCKYPSLDATSIYTARCESGYENNGVRSESVPIGECAQSNGRRHFKIKEVFSALCADPKQTMEMTESQGNYKTLFFFILKPLL